MQWQETEEKSTGYYLKVNNTDFYKPIDANVFVRVSYLKSTSYLFFHNTDDNLVYALTFPTNSSAIPILEELLKYSSLYKAPMVNLLTI